MGDYILTIEPGIINYDAALDDFIKPEVLATIKNDIFLISNYSANPDVETLASERILNNIKNAFSDAEEQLSSAIIECLTNLDIRNCYINKTLNDKDKLVVYKIEMDDADLDEDRLISELNDILNDNLGELDYKIMNVLNDELENIIYSLYENLGHTTDDIDFEFGDFNVFCYINEINIEEA